MLQKGKKTLNVQSLAIPSVFILFFSFVNLQYGLSHHLNDGRQNLLGAIMIAGHYVIPEVIKALSLSTVVNYCLHVKFFMLR